MECETCFHYGQEDCWNHSQDMKPLTKLENILLLEFLKKKGIREELYQGFEALE